MTEAGAPHPSPWPLAARLFVAAFGAVLLVLVAVLARGNWFGGPPTLAFPMRGFEAARGHAAPAGEALAVDAVDAGGTAILSSRVAPVAAERYPRVDWRVVPTVEPRPALAFAWATREQPGRTFVKPLQWQETGVAPLELAAADGWAGTVTGIALVVRGPLPQPLLVQGATLPGISAASAAREVLGEWAERRPFTGGSVTYPFDAERDHHLSLLAAVALALALAGGGYLLLARRRRWPFDGRVLGALFIGGWLLLDARWQVNLWRQLAATAQQFGGRSGEEKLAAAADAQLYQLVRDLGAVLPPAPARVVVVSDHLPLRARAAYFLYPRSANGFYQGIGPRPLARGLDALAAGDHVLLIVSADIAYDRAGGALVGRDGRRRAVDEVAVRADGTALVRVR